MADENVTTPENTTEITEQATAPAPEETVVVEETTVVEETVAEAPTPAPTPAAMPKPACPLPRGVREEDAAAACAQAVDRHLFPRPT